MIFMKLKVRILTLALLITGTFFAATSSSSASSARVFQGCWTFYPAGQCRAVYKEGTNYYLCGACDDSGNPGSGSCGKISQQTLNQGYWCS